MSSRFAGFLQPAAILGLLGVAAASWADADHAPIGAAARMLPIFDAHMHYNAGAWGTYPEATVISLMDRSGVVMALVSSTPDAGTILLFEYAPQRIVPELRPYHDAANASNWTRAPNMLAYLRERMHRYPHQGLGEFHIHRLDPHDTAMLRQIAALAREHGALIHIHSDAEPVDFLYGVDPDLTVIWAHVGMTEKPPKIREMMARYPGLHADTSYREYEILGGDGSALDPAWYALLVDFPDRFLVGSDTWTNAQWERYEEIIAINRGWLAQLPRAVAEKIAFRNAERLFRHTTPGVQTAE
jgi:predicted TIM-barrel fold metal-dependent hydrolase